MHLRTIFNPDDAHSDGVIVSSHSAPPRNGDQGQASIRVFAEAKAAGRKLTVLTCYDNLFARLLNGIGLDAVLVGDSLGQVMLGYPTTLPVTVADMIHHASAVRRGIQDALLIVDMPFLSYQVSRESAVLNAGTVLKETGAEAVKIEGGGDRTVACAAALVEVGIPVMGHLGLTPQSLHQLGGYSVRGREAAEAKRLEEQALALQAAGCFSLVLELVPTALATKVSQQLDIPTIGIGAGAGCDGQVLVLPDMLGLNEGFEPKFLRRFADLGPAVREAVADYVEAVRRGEYPSTDESYDG